MSRDGTIEDIKNKEIRRLCESLKQMPEYLAEKRMKALERKEFCRRVFEQACRDAGLLDRKIF